MNTLKHTIVVFLISIISIFYIKPIHAQRPANLVLLDSVFEYVCYLKIKHPNIVMRQVILETGWLKSKYLMSKNNIFGFRHKNYITYGSWKECVDYYKKWQDKHYTNPNEDYYDFLVRIRYAVSNYPPKLKKIRFDRTCTE